MEEEYEELYNNKEKIQHYLQSVRTPVKIGDTLCYWSLFKGEKLLLCFSQPSIEDLEELLKTKETIIFLN